MLPNASYVISSWIPAVWRGADPANGYQGLLFACPNRLPNLTPSTADPFHAVTPSTAVQSLESAARTNITPYVADAMIAAIATAFTTTAIALSTLRRLADVTRCFNRFFAL